jgi:ABC-2 type transport system permease protein
MCYVLYAGLDFTASIFNGKWAHFISNGGIASHYEALSRGVIAFSDLVYYVSVTFLFLYFTKLRIEQ